MPEANDDAEDPRREFLIRALAAGLLAAGTPAWAQLFGNRPERLPPGRSIHELTGKVTINGQPASATSKIGAADRIETGPESRLIFVVGADAFLVRENSRLELSGSGAVVSVMRIVTGKLLSVFGNGSKRILTPTASLGIRGTGVYVDAQPDRTYGCTCYGEVLISAVDDPKVQEKIVSRHHDSPRYILKAGAGKRIQPAPFIDHTDVELALIESLVGRTPPFALFDEDYGGARRY
jgi:hypothetical protein